MEKNKALITGIHGFAGRQLCLQLLKSQYSVTGLSRGIHPLEQKIWDDENLSETPVLISDLSDVKQIQNLDDFSSYQYVFHLAGTAFIPEGWKNPAGIIQSNTINTINLLNALKESGFKGRFIYISSSDVYGTVLKNNTGFSENDCCNPESPYAATKYASELFSKYFLHDEIDILIARPFNHIGPGQNKSFVVPAFLHRLIDAKQNNKSEIEVGDIESGRDFTDVRDVVNAYRFIAENGASGETYNICSGKVTSIKEILKISMETTGIDVNFKVNPEFLRQEGPSNRYGDASKIKSLGWEPHFSTSQSIQDMYNYIMKYS
ncbi:MAG: GDP-mannose 4,6-dehydratase [Spirochaetia bacterium]|nr:GDP-mannose 4,6-dehydratase [Spirochaetia bacterium]